MARRKSTIGHDPLEAVSLGEPARSAPAAKPAAMEPTPRVRAKPAGKPIEVTLLPPTKEPTERAEQAAAIVRSYYGWSSAAGMLPVPFLDFAAVIGVQVRMLEKLAKLYDKPFDKNMVRPIVVILLSGASGASLVLPLAGLLKVVPVVGTLASLLASPALAAASCWATGQVFIHHFESGGTFLDFEPAKVRAHYAEELRKAKGGG